MEFYLWVMFVYKDEGEETIDPLLQNNSLSDASQLVVSFYFEP